MKINNFSEIYSQKQVEHYLDLCLKTGSREVENVLLKTKYSFQDFLVLISPALQTYLENMAQVSHQITVQRFGKVVQLYIPLYLSNVCYNTCQYCGFRQDIKMNRYTLSVEDVLNEAEKIKQMGFKHILLVSGTAPEEVNMDYLRTIIRELNKDFTSIVLEIYMLEQEQYHDLLQAGAEGVTIYQETYHPDLYNRYHTSGSKTDYLRRLNTPDRAGRAGLRRINIGALLGLADWRYEAISLALHCEYILKHYWQSQLSLSFPRITNCPRDFSFDPVADKDLVQMIMAFRLLIPDLNLVISTRERADFRMNLIRLGITQISAGSKTTPGGYAVQRDKKEEQFAVEDLRDPAEIAQQIRQMGYEPVWKDWEQVLL